MTDHPFDTAITLRHAGGDRFMGTTSPAYANMVGPYGGVTAAQMLAAVLQHPALLGDPAALTVNFAAALQDGPFAIQALPVRTNRSTQHWQLTMTQPGADGADAVCTTGTAVTAMRRAVWGASDVPMPLVAAADTLPRAEPAAPMAWLQRYDMRLVDGGVPPADTPSDTVGDSRTRLWVRDVEPRPLDACSLCAMSDIFFPRVWLRRPKRVPAGTVTISTYFHAGAAELATVGTGWLLAQARGQVYAAGLFDHTAQLWSEAGTALATTHQLVYYKE